MILKLWLCTASFLGPILVVNSVCNYTPRVSGCQRNNSDYVNDTTVYPTSTVNCSFLRNLCCYRQGCFDDGMEHWNATDGHASVVQSSSGCGANSYSVLESPWVNFPTPSCVEFTYSRDIPYQLHVFLAFRNSTPPSKKDDSQNLPDNQHRTARFDIEHLTGKIQFRVRGGGALHESFVKIDYVRITEGRCQHNATPQYPEASDPSTCNLVTTAAPTTVHSTSSATTHLNYSPRDASTSSQPPSTNGSSSDMSTGSLCAVIVSVIVGAVVVGVVIVLIVRRRRRTLTDQKPERSGSDGTRGQAVYENQGFHAQPARHPVEDSSRVNPRDLSDPRDPARPSDSIDDYLMPMNVYEGLANRNIEQNPYDALAHQNNTYEGLSQNRNENRTYDSLEVSRGQNEDSEIPDTTSKNDTRFAEVNKDSSEYYNQPRLKKSGISSSSQAVPLSQVSEYQNIST